MDAETIAKRQHTCRRCGGASKWPNLCAPCAIADFEDEDSYCWQCGGEGYTYDCFEEYACVDPEGGCDLCMRRCDVCNPRATIIEQENRDA